MAKLKPNCPWRDCSSTNDHQDPLTDEQAALLPASVKLDIDKLLRCDRCGVIYNRRTIVQAWVPRGFVDDHQGLKWVSWQIGHHRKNP